MRFRRRRRRTLHIASQLFVASRRLYCGVLHLITHRTIGLTGYIERLLVTSPKGH